MVGRWRDDEPAAMILGAHAQKLRRAVEREVQLGRISLISDDFHLPHKAGVEFTRADEIEERCG